MKLLQLLNKLHKGDKMPTRKMVKKLVIGFANSTQAMTMESVCPKEKGRLIPKPSALGAGCGLAFCCSPEIEAEILALMSKNNISWSDKAMIDVWEN